jgi:hypothetical protein
MSRLKDVLERLAKELATAFRRAIGLFHGLLGAILVTQAMVQQGLGVADQRHLVQGLAGEVEERSLCLDGLFLSATGRLDDALGLGHQRAIVQETLVRIPCLLNLVAC